MANVQQLFIYEETMLVKLDNGHKFESDEKE